MKTPIEIISYSHEHHDGVVKLWQEIFPKALPRNEPNSVIKSKLSVQPELFFVAVQSGEVIGTVMSGYDGRRGWVYSVAVSQQHRRKGIGTALMKHAEESLKTLGCVKINLQILTDNSDVQEFYRILGYHIEDRISMGKQLNATRQA